MGGEFSFDDFLMERDVFEDAIHAAMRREEAAKQSAERGE